MAEAFHIHQRRYNVEEERSKWSRCKHHEHGDFRDQKYYCTPDEAKTIGDKWEQKYEIDPAQCENCTRFKSMYIEYPITVNGIDTKPITPWGVHPCLCRVRPCSDNKEKKTYLGIYIGELPKYPYVTYSEEDKMLKFSVSCNPMIYIPEHDSYVFGDSCWWSVIESEDDLKDITDDTIDNTWYVKLLKGMIKEQPDGLDKSSTAKTDESDDGNIQR